MSLCGSLFGRFRPDEGVGTLFPAAVCKVRVGSHTVSRGHMVPGQGQVRFDPGLFCWARLDERYSGLRGGGRGPRALGPAGRGARGVEALPPRPIFEL